MSKTRLESLEKVAEAAKYLGAACPEAIQQYRPMVALMEALCDLDASPPSAPMSQEAHITCSECGGEGIIDLGLRDGDCPTCSGTGKAKKEGA